ncbi:hypothetical protein PENTCL1PPCAC_13339, partial [Pristionchus entomophagus]
NPILEHVVVASDVQLRRSLDVIVQRPEVLDGVKGADLLESILPVHHSIVVQIPVSPRLSQLVSLLNDGGRNLLGVAILLAFDGFDDVGQRHSNLK